MQHFKNDTEVQFPTHEPTIIYTETAEQVWVMETTGEAFGSYEEYLHR